MAILVHNAGLALIEVGTGDAGNLEQLGYTRNGAEPTFEAFMIDVPGDANGGDEGPPIEIQLLGEIARVRLEMTKWDAGVADKIAARWRGDTAVAGVIPTSGKLLFVTNADFRLLINSPRTPFNFPRAVPRAVIEINKGTKFSTLILEFECHIDDSGELYNDTII